MIGILVIGDGRWEYLEQCVNATRENVPSQVASRLMINDEADPKYCGHLDAAYPEWQIYHTHRLGMAGAVQCGWLLAISAGVDYVLHLEEDMLLTRPLPIAQAVEVLESHPELAQMCFKREPFDPSEGADQLQAICNQAPNWGSKAAYTWHDYLFSLNPCLIPKRILEISWPAGPIGVGNEDGFTKKLLEQGYLFGSWGHIGDEPFARHLGVQRSAQWAL